MTQLRFLALAASLGLSSGAVWFTASGSTHYGPSFWATKCQEIPADVPYIKMEMGSVTDYFKPFAGTTWCEMLSTDIADQKRHFWSPDGRNWVVPVANGHLGGSESNWPSDGRTYVSFWGSGSTSTMGGCCHYTYSDGPSWGKDFTMSFGEAEPAWFTGDGATHYGPSFWGTKCQEIAAGVPYIIVEMGGVTDYYRPVAGATWCEVLNPPVHTDKHYQWSADALNWVVPTYGGHLGGSESYWPSDGRTYLSFWGSGSTSSMGGCCHYTYSDGPSWGKDFTIKLATTGTPTEGPTSAPTGAPTDHAMCTVDVSNFKNIFKAGYETYSQNTGIVHSGASVTEFRVHSTYVILDGGRIDCPNGPPTEWAVFNHYSEIYVKAGGFFDTNCLRLGKTNTAILYERAEDVKWPDNREAAGFGEGYYNSDQMFLTCGNIVMENYVEPTCALNCNNGGTPNADCSACEGCDNNYWDTTALCDTCIDAPCVNGALTGPCGPDVCECDLGFYDTTCDKTYCEDDIVDAQLISTVTTSKVSGTVAVMGGGSVSRWNSWTTFVIYKNGAVECPNGKQTDGHNHYSTFYVLNGGTLDTNCLTLGQQSAKIIYEPDANIIWPDSGPWPDAQENDNQARIPCSAQTGIVLAGAPPRETNAPTTSPTVDPTGSPTASHVDTATALSSYGSASFIGVHGDDVYHCSGSRDSCLKNSLATRFIWTHVDEVPYQANDAMQPFDTFTATTSDGKWATEPGAITFRNEVDQYAQKFPTSCDCQSGGKD